MEIKERPVLIVDDELDILSQLKTVLNQEGFEVVSAANGTKGLDEFKKHRPAICILDYKMPGLNGLDLLREIKKIDPKCEVILISGHADMKIAIQAMKDHAFDFLKKPIDIIELVEKINEVITGIEIKNQYETGWSGGVIAHKVANHADPISEITLNMDLDEIGGPRFSKELEKLEHSGNLNKHIVLSLGKVNRINNVGLNVLIDIHNRAQQNGYKIGLSNVTVPVLNYLHMLGYDKYFYIMKSSDKYPDIFTQM